MTQTIKTAAMTLHENGYAVLPIKPGTKHPADLSGWQSMQLGETVYKAWASNDRAGHGVGIRLGNGVYALDVDVLDAELSDLIRDDAELELGYAPVRVGLAPKFAMLFRSEDEIRKHKVHLVAPDGAKHAVELLGKGQQIVAYGVHPDTGSPYTWSDCEPLGVAVADLPKVSIAELRAWMTRSLTALLPDGWAVEKMTGFDEHDAQEDEDDFMADLPLAIDGGEVAEALGLYSAAGLGYEDWLRVGMALHHQYRGGAEGMALWDDWSKASDDYDHAEIKAKWRGFGSGGGRSVTFASVLKITNAIKREAQSEQAAVAAVSWSEQIKACQDAAELRGSIAAGISTDKTVDKLAFSELCMVWQARYKELKGVRIPIADIRSLLRPKRERVTTSSEDLPEWLHGWVWVTDRDKFYRKDSHEWLTAQSFNAKYTRMIPPGEDGETNPSAAYNAALHEYKIDTVTAAMYAPHLDDRFEFNGIEAVNTFRPSSVPPCDPIDADGAAAIDVVRAHVAHIMGGEDERQAAFIDWMAWVVQNPGRKMRYVPIIKGIQGDGKSVLGELLGHVMGGENVRVISTQAVSSQFNGWAEGMCVGVLEEVRMVGHSRHDVINAVKPLITNDIIAVHKKGIEQYNAINTANYIAFTNHADAIPVGDSDRRWWVMSTPWSTRAEMEAVLGDAGVYFDRLHAAIRDNGGALRTWLMEHKISETFKPNGAAPMTKEKAAMAGMERSDDDLRIMEVLSTGGHGVSQDVVCTRSLNAILSMLEIETMQSTALSTCMKRLGFIRYPKQVKWRGDVCRVWVRSVRTMDSEKIRAALEATITSEGDDFDIPF